MNIQQTISQSPFQALFSNIPSSPARAVAGMIPGANNFLQAPNPYPNLKSPIPAANQITNQLPPGYKSPVPQNQVLPHPAGPSAFQSALNGVQNFFSQFAPSAQAQTVRPTPTPNPTLTPTPTPQTFNMPNNWNGSGPYGGGKLPQNAIFNMMPASPTPTTAPPQGGSTPNPNVQPNITIPFSQGGQKTLPPGLSQILMNAFNNIGQATNSAKILNHPKQITAIGNEQQQGINTVPNYGENAGFKQSNIDTQNSDGSIDRGLFRINSNTFNGIMAHPQLKQVAAQYGIRNWEDMNDPQKNAYMARLIYMQGGWGRWFAGQQNLRAQGAPNR